MKNIGAVHGIILAILSTTHLTSCIDLDAFTQPEYTLEGRITDANTGQPLVGAEIRFGEERDVSNPEGHFAIRMRTMGQYSLDLSLDGYRPYTASVNLNQNRLTVNASLTRQGVEPAPHHFYGYIIDEQTNQAIANVRATIRERSYVTGPSGRFDFDNIIEGTTYNPEDIVLDSPCLTLTRLSFNAYPNYSYLSMYVRVTTAGTDRYGDLNGDRLVDISDLDLFIPHMNTRRGDPKYSELADINNDDAVDLADYQIIRSNWNQVVFGDDCRN